MAKKGRKVKRARPGGVITSKYAALAACRSLLLASVELRAPDRRRLATSLGLASLAVALDLSDPVPRRPRRRQRQR